LVKKNIIDNIIIIMNVNNYENNYPSDMINKNGKKEYAYVTFLIIDELYAPTSIVLAESLKKIGSLAELVIMIDKNINDNTIDLLRRFYDRIILVEKIVINHKDKTQKYILTKLLGLELDYKKIIIIDIDSIILKYPDNSFSLKSPSLIYSKNQIKTGYIVIEPNKDLLNNILNKIKKKEYEKNLSKQEKPLAYLIEDMFKDINKLDIKILNFSEDYKESYGVQYTINKPFIIKSKIPIETRMKWDHYKLWYYYFRNIINKYPDMLTNYECLKETIEFSKYFVAIISRFALKNYNIFKVENNDDISAIYKISRNSKNKDYYHLNISKEYDSDNLNFLYKNNSIANFIEYIKNKNYGNLIPNNLFTNIIDIKTLLANINNSQQHLLLDYILTEYVRINPNIFIILTINEIENNEDDIDDDDDDDDDDDNDKRYKKYEKEKIDEENLIWMSQYKLLGMVIKNILFNINQNYVYEQRINLLSSYNEFTFYNVRILIYETAYPLYFNNINQDHKKIYIINDTNSKVRLSSIFMNRNTLKMIKEKKINYYKNDKMDKEKLLGLLKFQTLKKWIYNNYTGDQLSNIIIIKSSPITIIDNNKYDITSMKILSNKLLEKMKIIYSRLKMYKNISSKYEDIINNINNPKYYWELEGIKFLHKN